MSKGEGFISAGVLPDNIRSKFSGSLISKMEASSYWVYKKAIISNTASNILIAGATAGTNDSFLNKDDIEELIAGDKVYWVAIRHTGNQGMTNTFKTVQGVAISHTGATPAYNGTGATSNIVLGPKEVFVAKLNGVTVDDLKAIVVDLSSDEGRPDGNGSQNVCLEVAALVEDIS